MGGRALGFDRNRAIVQLAREIVVVVLHHRVRQVDQRLNVIRMMLEGFGVRQTGSAAKARVIEQRPEVTQRTQMRGVSLDDGDVRIARIVITPQQIEHVGAMIQQGDVVRRSRELGLDILEIADIRKRWEHRRHYAGSPTQHCQKGTASMKIEPYLFFHGVCEEAMDFYAGALGGTVEYHRFEGSPMAENLPPDWGSKIMHATLNAHGVNILGSDGRPGSKGDGDDIALSVGVDDPAQAERIFNALSVGGSVTMPFQDVFWGGKYGMFTDRFGFEWMVSGARP